MRLAKASSLGPVALAALVVAVPASSVAHSGARAVAVAPPSSAFLPRPPLAPPRQLVFFGYVEALTRAGSGYVVRVDPASVLTGSTATRAAVEDKVIAPGDIAPNDYYIRNESRRVLTYRVSASAHVTVITRGIRATRIPVAELAQIVKGRNPGNRPLFAPENGFWIRVAGDRALALDQQYTP